MKNRLLLLHFILCCLFYSCNSKQVSTSKSSKSTKKQSANLTHFSFGAKLLMQFDQPQSWSLEYDKDKKNAAKLNTLTHSIDGVFFEIGQRRSIPVPLIKKTILFKIADDSLACISDNKINNDFKVRLSNIDDLECYYQYGEFPVNLPRPDNYNYQHNCIEYGNIVLINHDRTAKKINVYHKFSTPEQGGDYNRYFYLEGNTINVYEEIDYESASTARKIYSIKIFDFEHITVTKFNNETKL